MGVAEPPPKAKTHQFLFYFIFAMEPPLWPRGWLSHPSQPSSFFFSFFFFNFLKNFFKFFIFYIVPRVNQQLTRGKPLKFGRKI
jgi:hypothetical protein